MYTHQSGVHVSATDEYKAGVCHVLVDNEEEECDAS